MLEGFSFGQFPAAAGDRTKNYSLKLQQRKLRLAIKKNCLTLGVAKHWTRLLRKVESPGLGIFESRLDKYWSGMV